ncbi:DUF932 domain-containing protein [Microvirga sp. VF16]|uniref:DUF932 domain-containing protein n=1 Tax=Microvirga sp. VF16 TaxID=2807101 RepID=UPI00193E7B89|nr:DUF932 domain-containing protein [Microvirga sp. VF16]QRM31082.1 DUF932 domain-containing protein [Microvirga sp. VF16]
MKVERLPLEEVRWLGQQVVRITGTLDDLAASLPRFSRRDFTHENALNEYLDLILRDPVPDDERWVPVSTVSKRYVLIQHQDTIGMLQAAFEQQNWQSEATNATVWLSDYGERMRVEVSLPVEPVEATVGDKIAAEVVLWNSVDRSRAFELAIRWRRLICNNGLTIWEGDRLRKVHHADYMSAASPIDFLVERLPKSRRLVEDLRSWAEIKFDPTSLVQWVDTDVTARWGKLRAARVFHVLRTGYDCAVGRPLEGQSASQIRVSLTSPVPGSPAPAGSAYDVYQGLLWVVGHGRSIEQEEELLADVLPLMADLFPALPERIRGAE